ncbi:concanavalin A-like lectin/glucanase [Bimuria novae-zelandiae CBS 107.79]|uniref:Concanavalin A-like lectin/glucanase n=1 Tax=Bimuria novae-zelandiae CBS 107.79 TaxID=1447943 RepID=A0A6A5UUD1_9PLEO|nr:concanavalin A-like lectin/glucanase [Bimuria novae-zelandiae CBS 107.79]
MVSKFQSTVAVVWPVAFLLQPAFSTEYITANSSTPLQNNEKCSCYVVNSGANSETPSYFQYHRFYDFRNLADRAGQYLRAPAVVDDWDAAPDLKVSQANILDSDAWNADWNIQTWSKNATEDFTLRMVNSPANIYLQQNNNSGNVGDASTYLTLRTTRGEDFQSVGEIENLQKNLMHVSMRMSARVIGDKGAVAGFFTFVDDDNESDIEILTNDPKDVIRYTNQPSADKDGNQIAAASQMKNKLPVWDEWQTHRIDWLDKDSYWYLNKDQVAASSYSVPRKPSYLVINMWSDGGSWSGNMTEGGSAEFQIQWIEMTFNTSGKVEGLTDPDPNSKRSVEHLGKRKEENCKVVCKIDDVKELGTPEIVSSSLAARVSLSWFAVVVVGLTSVCVGL